VGTAVVDRIRLPDGSLTRSPGGTATIGAVALTAAARALGLRLDIRLGVAVGNDPPGRYLRSFLRTSAGIKGALVLDKMRRTKVNQISVADDGSWTLDHSLPDSVRYLLSIDGSPKTDAVLVGGLNSLTLSEPLGVRSLLKSTRDRRRFVTLSRGGEAVARDTWDLIAANDWILCNLQELSGALGRPVAGLVAEATRDLGWQHAVVTAGAGGCWLVTQGVCEHFGTAKVASRNTLGAGDVFAAVFVATILAGRTADTAVRLATAAGGTVAATGSWRKAVELIWSSTIPS
jgi:sugar/nucleoside kinase (ribokinase family)